MLVTAKLGTTGVAPGMAPALATNASVDAGAPDAGAEVVAPNENVEGAIFGASAGCVPSDAVLQK